MELKEEVDVRFNFASFGIQKHLHILRSEDLHSIILHELVHVITLEEILVKVLESMDVLAVGIQTLLVPFSELLIWSVQSLDKHPFSLFLVSPLILIVGSLLVSIILVYY